MTDTILDALREALEFAEIERDMLLESLCRFSPDGKPDPSTLCAEDKPVVDACESLIATLTTAIAAREAEGWQPIETAPKDGTPVVLFYPHRYKGKRGGSISIGCFSGGYWFDTFVLADNDCTHWRPLPSPPSAP